MNGYIIALALILGFPLIAYILQKKGILQRYNMELYGPFIMWKTKKGREFIDRSARKRERFWERYADFSLGVIFFFMVFSTLLLIWVAMLASRIPASKAPSPQMMLGIPGINPIIPLWYGILGLAVAIIFHEFSHGILSRVAKVTIKSLGLLFFIVPVGAFVEPDDEEVNRLPRRKRMRMYAVGPSANIFLAIIFAFLFIGAASQIQPIHDGIVVYGVYPDSPASDVLTPGEEIISINGTEISSPEELLDFPFPPANKSVSVMVFDGHEAKNISITSGLIIVDVTEGYAAANSGIKEGMMISSLNGSLIHNYSEFLRALSHIKPGQTVSISLYERNENGVYVHSQINHITFTTEDKYSYYAKYLPSLNREEYRGKAIMGVSVREFGLYPVDPEYIPRTLAHPFWGVHNMDDFVSSSLRYLSLPVTGIMGIADKTSGLYTYGALNFLGPSGFWVLANTLYWIFWLNLMVGITNALPAIPLDGGFIFRDAVSWIIEKIRRIEKEKADRIAGSISTATAFFILFLILWQIIAPRLATI